MAEDFLTMNFDIPSLARIQRLAGWEKTLGPLMEVAIANSIDLLQRDAETFMWATFTNPQGTLENSIQTEVISPYEGQVWTDSPYGWRREMGFSGLTDSLGRYYPLDPGIHFFETVLGEDIPNIEAYIKEAVQWSLDELGA